MTCESLKINILHVGHAKLDKKWNYENVISPFTRLFYVTTGKAEAYHTNQAFDLKPGHMYLIPSYTYNKYKCDLYHEQYYIGFFEEIEHGLSIYSQKKFIYEVKATETDLNHFKRLLVLFPNLAVKNSDPKVSVNRPALRNFNKRDNEIDAGHYLETKGIISILLSKFIRDSGTSEQQQGNQGDFNKILNYLVQNLHGDLTVAKMAHHCSLNIDYFSRAFKHKFGMRPNKYIQQKRIERAQLLLLTTNDTLEQIAESVGMKNMSYFSRVFKRITGKSPAKFRKKQLNS
ncbi:AraC family transcriptional regulator [Arenibacter sp. F20364]|uniref:helix-turn-helix domain-containing protein n=1 Tax=Arenibacter sp. F20364 TaxID=2926415 RepID=UPI001FF1764C